MLLREVKLHEVTRHRGEHHVHGRALDGVAKLPDGVEASPVQQGCLCVRNGGKLLCTATGVVGGESTTAHPLKHEHNQLLTCRACCVRRHC